MGKMNVYPAVLSSLRDWLGHNEFHVQKGRRSTKMHSCSCFVYNTCMYAAKSSDRLEKKKGNRVHTLYSNWTRVVCNKLNSKFQSVVRRGRILRKFGLIERENIVCRQSLGTRKILDITRWSHHIVDTCWFATIRMHAFHTVEFIGRLNRIRFPVSQPVAISVRFVSHHSEA